MSRVTQSMLSSNMLRNLNNSYAKMSKYQNMINTGMKITRASEDPVVAVKGMKYRVQLDQVGQYERNINEANGWLDTTDTSFDQVGQSLIRIKELIVQAANDTNTSDDRMKIKQEIDQITNQMKDIANTQYGGKFIFSGTHTQQPLYVNAQVIDVESFYKSLDTTQQQAFYTGLTAITDGTSATPGVSVTAREDYMRQFADANSLQLPMKILTDRVENSEASVSVAFTDTSFHITNPTNPSETIPFPTINLSLTTEANIVPMTAAGIAETVEVEVFNGIRLTLNTKGASTFFSTMDTTLKQISSLLADPNVTSEQLSKTLGSSSYAVNEDLTTLQGKLLEMRADIGARMNRVELMENRMASHKINITKQKSNNEDTDYALTITNMTAQESVHQAALSVGAKIIQQTLVDFL